MFQLLLSHGLASRVVLLVSCASFVCSSAVAQFAPNRNISATDSLSAFESMPVDLDGDGVLDVLTGSGIDGNLVWYKGLGSGAFGPALFIDAGVEELRAIDVADMDGDGDMDPVRLSSLDGSVVMYENLGSGRFMAARPITSPLVGATDFCLDRINGDLNQDLVVVVPTSGDIVWFESLGGTAFSNTPTVIGNFTGAHSLACQDLDSDNDLDVAAWSDIGFVAFSNPGGAGVWQDLPIPGPTYVRVEFLNPVDLDLDGDYDLLIGGRPTTATGNTTLSWRRQDPNGLGSYRELYRGLQVNYGEVLDLDGDGDNDVLLATGTSSSNGQVVGLENLGGGVMGGWIGSSRHHGSSLAVGDLDGDGDLDVLVTSELNGRPVFYIPLGSQSSWTPAVNLSVSGTISPNVVATSDFDGDGFLDLVVGSYDTNNSGLTNLGTLSWFRGSGDGRFGPAQMFAEQATRVRQVVAGDLDGDGDPDLVVAGRPLVWQENLGGGTFGLRNELDTGGGNVVDADIGDIDGDGAMDIIASATGHGIVWFRNLGGGDFGALRAISGQEGTQGVAVADLDGDGDEDIAYIQLQSRAVWRENLGGGVFGPAQVLVGVAEAFQEPKAIEVRDMDLDGVLDIVTGGFRGTFFVRGLGGGTFDTADPVAVLPAAWGKQGFAVGDFDGDGAPDIAVKAWTPSGSAFPIRWSRNLGGGSFGNTSSISSDIGAPEFLAAGDLDGDGDDDLIYGSRSADIVGWYESLVLGTPLTDNIGSSYCGPAYSNSTGAPAKLWAEGSVLVLNNDLSLHANGIPSNVFGLFLGSPNQWFTPFPGGSQGNLCLGGPLGRFYQSVQLSGPNGALDYQVDLTSIPLFPPVAAQPGETWYFQAWFRDTNPGPASNLTNGVTLTFR